MLAIIMMAQEAIAVDQKWLDARPACSDDISVVLISHMNRLRCLGIGTLKCDVEYPWMRFGETDLMGGKRKIQMGTKSNLGTETVQARMEVGY